MPGRCPRGLLEAARQHREVPNGDREPAGSRSSRCSQPGAFRAVNEKLRKLNEAFSEVSETYAIACECADVSCVQTVHVQMEEYLAVRDPRRFVVLATMSPHVERVISSTDGYVVVEKTAAVSEITEATDPNA